jgi:putative transposase
MDRGIRDTAHLSNGDVFSTPVATPSEVRRQRIRNRRLSRKKKGSKNRAKARKRALRLSRKVTSRCHHAVHTFTTRLAKTKPVIVMEDLHVRAMSASAAGTVDAPGTHVAQKRGLNRQIRDQRWGMIRQMLAYKCLWYGSRLIVVPAAYTSQTCAVCGHVDAKNRSGDRFQCLACGHTDNADHNASVNILARWTAGDGTDVTNVPMEGRKRVWRKSHQRSGDMPASASGTIPDASVQPGNITGTVPQQATAVGL